MPNDIEAWAAKLLRSARRQLRDGGGNLSASEGLWLTATVHALQAVVDGPTGQRVVAPLVAPGAVCAVADGACAT